MSLHNLVDSNTNRTYGLLEGYSFWSGNANKVEQNGSRFFYFGLDANGNYNNPNLYEPLGGQSNVPNKWPSQVTSIQQAAENSTGDLFPTPPSALTPDEQANNSDPNSTRPQGTFDRNPNDSVDEFGEYWYADDDRSFRQNPQPAIGICSLNAIAMRTTGAPLYTISNNGGIQPVGTGTFPSGNLISRPICAGNAFTLDAGSGVTPSTPVDVKGNLYVQGGCDGALCRQGGPGSVCSFVPASPFLPVGTGRTCTPCTPLTGNSTLPVDYGGAIDNFSYVAPRSAAFADYVSSSYFKDNFRGRDSQLDLGVVFTGYYLSRKLVDGECVTMLCPESDEVDNYCRALRDCET